MSEDKLKPCPFCGAPGKYVEECDHHGPYFSLGCSNEECHAYLMCYTLPAKDYNDAVAAWNRRAGEVAQ